MALFEFAKHVAKRVLDPMDEQDCTILIVGVRGSGKSEMGIALAESIAKEEAIIKYNDESRYTNFFDAKQDVGIVLEDELLRVMQRETEAHHVKVLDDVAFAKGFNSRKSLTDENDATTSLFGVNRTERGVLIITTQLSEFLDKRIRILADFIIEMDGPKYPNQNVNMGTINIIQMKAKMKTNKIWYPYIRTTDDDGQITRFEKIATGYASPETRKPYREVRVKVSKIVNELKLNNIVNGGQAKFAGKEISATQFAKKYKKEHPPGTNDKTAYIDEVFDAAKNAGYSVSRGNIIKALSYR